MKAETEYADSLYAAGNYDDAREAYIRALGYKPKDQPTIDRVVELNNRLGLSQPGQPNVPASASADTLPHRQWPLWPPLLTALH